jgi:LruC domain-containing protein
MKASIYTGLFLLLLASCQKEDSPSAISNPISSDIKELNIPASFNFDTDQNVNVAISAKSLSDAGLVGVKVNFYTAHPDSNGALMTSGFTDFDGSLSMELQVPAYLDSIYVEANTIGFANIEKVLVSSSINVDFGGPLPQRNFKTNNSLTTRIPLSGKYYYMGAFNPGKYKGLPLYLETPGDVLSQAFLDDVNASLPEERPVPTYNPQYLTSGNELDIQVNALSDVWVTFVAEGAGYRNSLGYYVYDSNNPPATSNDIDSIFVILPNASFASSGGELYSGDKVNLGTFPAGKSISWVLFQNAWNGTDVNINANKFYSRSEFNTNESNANLRQHTVQLADIGRELLLNGFEDQTRSSGSDNDFNDLIFYVSANPWTAIETGSVPNITPESDDDGDGISNESDDFPTDPTRAIRNTFSGTLAYEDLWPSQGDYDFNDMVIDYEVDHIINGNNNIVDIEADWTVRAVGAGFKNGFGFQFNDIDAADISSITGQNLQENIVNNNANGTETGQTKATIIAFDNVYKVIPASGSSFINTVPGAASVAPETLTNVINFSSPQSIADVGIPPYNAFIFANATRGREIHLPGNTPTDLADPSLFGTSADATNSANEYYYKTTSGLPWAINITDQFQYPVEFSPINQGYLNFSSWATSGGTINTNWFTDAPGNIDATYIY